MPVFQYKAKYATGEVGEGVVEASTKAEAVSQIRSTYEIVISVTQVKGEQKDIFEKYRKVNMKAFSLMCKQFSIIMKAGLPIVQTVDLVARQTEDKLLKKILTQVAEDIAAGWGLAFSFTQRAEKLLPNTFIETVRSGEESGDLIKAFDRMSIYYDKMTKTKQKVVSAMIYPTFVIVVAIFVVIVIMTIAVPQFTKTFESMNMELPIMTKIVIALSHFFSNFIWLIILLFAGAGVGLNLYNKTESGAIKVDRFKLAIPIVGDIMVMGAASQFSNTMSTMLSSGMPILSALGTSARSISSVCISQQILDIIPAVENGHSLGECMKNCDDLPEMLVEMVATGEATGSLEDILNVQAEYYDNEVDVLIARLMSLLEPAIICVLAVVVVGILLSIYLPMFNLYDAI